MTWATHLFFIFSLLGRQYLRPEKHYPGHEIDYYVPFFTIIQFLFYMGWLKVRLNCALAKIFYALNHAVFYYANKIVEGRFLIFNTLGCRGIT